MTRKLILFGAPLFVGVVNLFHPVHFETVDLYDGLQPQVGWWITLHVLNLVGFALLGLAAFLLVQDRQGIAATVSKVALALFVPFYVAFDSIAGISTGTLVRYAQGLAPAQLAIVKPAIDAFWTSDVTTMLGIVGSIAWSTGMIAAAVAFTEPRRRPALAVLGIIASLVIGWGSSTSSFGTPPWWIVVGLVGLIALGIGRPAVPAALLILAGMLFGTTHVVPFGPLGMVCFVGAALWLEFVTHMVRVSKEIATVV